MAGAGRLAFSLSPARLALPPPTCLLLPLASRPHPRTQVGQEVELLCLGRDAKGQVRLSRKALLARQAQAAAQADAAQRLAQGGGLDADK